MIKSSLILLSLAMGSEALAERFLISCTLTRSRAKCIRDVYKMNHAYTLDDMEKDHNKAVAKNKSATALADCERKDLSDRLELRLVTVCLNNKNRTAFEFRTIWPTDARAINYYRKRGNEAIANKMSSQSRVRDKNGGKMPSGKDTRYN